MKRRLCWLRPKGNHRREAPIMLVVVGFGDREAPSRDPKGSADCAGWRTCWVWAGGKRKKMEVR
jgi:hypothetical protein